MRGRGPFAELSQALQMSRPEGTSSKHLLLGGHTSRTCAFSIGGLGPYLPLRSRACTTYEVLPKPKNERPVPQSDPYAVVAHCPGWDPVWQSLGPVLCSLGRAGWNLEASELAEVAPGFGIGWGSCLRGE